jgi:hypothetical protein
MCIILNCGAIIIVIISVKRANQDFPFSLVRVESSLLFLYRKLGLGGYTRVKFSHKARAREKIIISNQWELGALLARHRLTKSMPNADDDPPPFFASQLSGFFSFLWGVLVLQVACVTVARTAAVNVV